jgi:hypothetical protein
MAKANEELPVLDANDINVLVQLVQNVQIKVSDIKVVSPVLTKCEIILQNSKKK